MSSAISPRILFAQLAFSLLISTFSLGADHASATAPHFSLEAKALYAAASEDKSPEGTDVVVLEDQETYVFDADGRSVHATYVVFKVLTQKGAEGWADASSGWEPWHEERPVLRARVITPDFAVHELDAKTIIDAPSREDEPDMYSDSRVFRAPLPAMAPGSVVEQEWVIKESAPLFGAGTVGRYFFGRVSVPVQHSRLVLDAPSSVTLRYVTQLLPELQPQRSEADGRVKIVFDHGPMTALEKSDTNLSSDVPAFPVLAFSTGTSWRQMAEEYAKTVDSHVSGADVKALVEKLTQGKQSRDDKARAILEYLDKNIRYTGVEFGEAAIVPHSPAETLAHKYGDCKDKSTLLVAMLRAADIPAFVALLNASERMDVATDLPGMGLFDHAIVYVPGNPDLWIDATDDYARLGQLPLGDQGRFALIVRPGTDALLQTSVSSHENNVLLELRDIFLAENGPARIVETSQPQGYFESEFRRFYTDKENKDHRESLTNYVKNQYLAEKLDRLDRSDPADFSKQFELVLESQKAKRGFTDLDTAVAAIRLEGLFSRLPDEMQKRESTDDTPADPVKPKKKRTADYQLPEPLVVEWRYRIVPPLGFQAKPLPQDTKLTLGPALLTEHFAAEADGTVRGVIRFDTVQRRLTVAQMTEMRNKIAEVREGEPILINFELTAQALLSQGKSREAFQSYRGLIAQHPKEAVHHLQIAKALLEGGLGDAARDEARQAVKLEPKSALAEKTLAQILKSDRVGRSLRPGSDYAGASAAYREAVKLDPDDKSTVGDLAILLEYNEDGARYGAGAKLKEAVAAYGSLSQEKLASLGLQNNLVFALFYAGEFAEARKAAEVLNPQPKGLIVACEAALKGSQAAITELNKRSSGDAELKQAATTAGSMLMNVRKYSLAADLLQAGASGDNAARSMGLASLLRKAELHEDLHFDETPSGLVRKFFVLTLGANLTLDQLVAISSKNGAAVMKNTDPDELAKTLKSGKEFRSELARSGASPDVTIDILMKMIDPKDEGNDSSGYREKLLVGGKSITVFIVKEDGKYKILDTAEKPNAIGLEILDRISANNLEGARTLLGWLREDQHLEGGDDPFSGFAFPRFWTKGKEADAHQMKLAAAAILVETQPTAKQGVAILEEARKSAASDTEKTNIDLALREGYGHVKDYEKLLEVDVELAKQSPESRSVFFSQDLSLRALGRYDDANVLVQQRLRRMPDDIDAMRTAASNDAAREDYSGAHDLRQKIVDAGKAEATDLNGLAWDTLFYDRAEGPDIESAVKATQLSQNAWGILHTLGCAYAEAGKTKEAREVLIQAMDLAKMDEPTPNFWYAFGRIAEQYGEQDAARANYAKVTKPKDDLEIPGSVYRLAQNRLKVLGEHPQAAVASTSK